MRLAKTARSRWMPHILTWLNPRTGERGAETAQAGIQENGDTVLPDKPDEQDWVLLVVSR